jgi:thioredoxin-like negative regulator of GroEL
VHFWAVWNGHDARMTKILERVIPTEMRVVIAVGTLDTDRPEHWPICRELKVLNLPFLAFYRDGSLIHPVVGLKESDGVEQINTVVASEP